jgi:hypothetical protein
MVPDAATNPRRPSPAMRVFLNIPEIQEPVGDIFSASAFLDGQ